MELNYRKNRTTIRHYPEMIKHHDVLIIGSGPIGITAARRLAQRGLRVTVLEAGTAITDPPGSHYRNQACFQQDPDSYFAAIGPYLTPVTEDADAGLQGVADTQLVGGQGVLWTNNCPRAMDFERWETMAPEQWNRKYAEAEEMLQVLPDPAAESRTGRSVHDRLQSALENDGRFIRGLPFAGRLLSNGAIYFNGSWDILAAAAPSARDLVEMQSGVRVTRLRYRGSRVTGVDVEGPGSYRGYLDAPVVLLAGGAVATPRLLHGSGIRPKSLGRGVSFHALLFGQVILESDMCPSASEPDIAPRQWIPPTADSPWHLQLLRDTCPFPPAEVVANPHRLLEIQAFLPMEFREENFLLIGDDDHLEFQFAFSDKDQERMRAMEADVRRLAGYLGRWRRGCELTWLPHGSAHLVGTCRMDRPGLGGVTDTQGRVHGFDNLYLATVGLIPTPVAVNPTLTAAALALNTCDALVN